MKSRIKRCVLWAIVSGLLLATAAAVSPIRLSRAANVSAYETSLVASVSNPSGVLISATWKDTSAQLVGSAAAGERVIIVGRDDTGKWLRVHFQAGYGYAPAKPFLIKGDINKVPVVDGNLPQNDLPDEVPTDDPVKFPILPTVTDYSKQIFERGKTLGMRPEIFSKIGDCMSADTNLFLGRFAGEKYDLGTYKNLQDVINYYRQVSPRQGVANSFAARSIGTYNGFTTIGVEDSTWLTAGTCTDGTSPLICEYTLSKPSIAIIMFGTNDITSLAPAQFDFYLRLIVHDTIDRGIVPLLNTFPGSPKSDKRSDQFNQIIYRIARDYDVPIANVWLAIQALPNHGRDVDSPYLSLSPTTHVSQFTGDNLQSGYTVRNLVTLQSLDILWRGLIKGGSASSAATTPNANTPGLVSTPTVAPTPTFTTVG